MKKGILLIVLFMFGTVQSQKINSKKLDKDSIVTIYTTAENTSNRLTKTGTSLFKKATQPKETQICIFVNPNTKFQTFLGIGGAITDASAEVFAKLSTNKQEEFLNSYYSTNGIGYSLARTTIHSCDFSSASYTYITEGDASLNSFSIAHDKQFKIPLLKAAIKVAEKLTLYASPWSPPAFMKTNNDMLHGGSLKPEFYQTWANYYAKFIKAYQEEGINVWGISIQNEPMANQRWESCIYTAEEERDFIKNYLGPTLEKQGLKNKKIIAWDHNRDLMFQRATTIFNDPQASKYIWGMGFHWYETWTGGQPMYENVKKVHEAYPTKNLIFTEGCNELFNPEKYQNWTNAERYGKSMINDFNNGTVAWTDWNILLDEKGGPNHVGNFCFAPIHANTITNELIYTPAFYYIGHFSKFIKPNAKRISSVASRSQLLTTSFLNSDKKVVTVVMNISDAIVEYELFVENKVASISIMPHAIQTLIY